VATPTRASALEIGRYVLFEEMASGGMATVHYGCLSGPAGFSRTVAIKRMHPTFAKDPQFVAMFLDEARIAARVRHPNVVATLDVVTHEGEVLLVMEYIEGASLSQVLRRLRSTGGSVPVGIAAGILVQVLLGLHAAHEAKGEGGASLGVVHRDVSPQNILIGVDGIARVADFGIAKATGRLQTTAQGLVKGKTAYMAPEQIRGRGIDRRVDVYAAGVVLWETLTGRRLFAGDSQVEVMNKVLEGVVPLPSTLRATLPQATDRIVERALSRDPEARYSTAREMALALEATPVVAATREIGAWVEAIASDLLTTRAQRVAEIESGSGTHAGPAVLASEPHVEAAEAQGRTGTATSHVADAASAQKRSTRAGLMGLLLAAALMAIVAALEWRRPSQVSSAATGAATSSSPTVPADVPTASATAPVEIEASAPSSSSGTVTAPKPRRSPEPRALPTARALDCKPPYTIDKAGNRRWKDGC
jgi:serine/threonine-protein kinase